MQRVYWNWKDADLTADLNAWMHGMMPAGLYRGFDKGAASTGWTLVLDHAVNGFTRVDENLTVSPLTGIIKSPQGSIISENDSISLPVQPADAAPRYDIVVCSHQHVEVVGGQPAVYSVVKGTPSSTPVAPAVANTTTDVLIGTIYVPANAASINACTYTKSVTPTFANTPQGIPFSQKGTAGGVATLGSDSYVNSLLPALATDAWLQNKIYSDEKVAIENVVGFDLDRYFTPYSVPIILVIQGGVVSTTGPSVSITAGIVHYNGKNYPLEASTVTGSTTSAYLEFIAGSNTVLDKTFSYSNGYFTLRDDVVPSFTVTSSHRLTTLKYLNCAVTDAVETATPTRVGIESQDYKLVKRGTLINLSGHISVGAITGADTSAPFIVLLLQARYAHAVGPDIRFPVSIINIVDNTAFGGYGIMQGGSRSITLYFGGPVTVGKAFYIDFNYSYEARYLH